MNSSIPAHTPHDHAQTYTRGITIRAGLTPGQDKLLVFIGGFIASRGYSPSFVEMKDGMGFTSTGAVASLVDGLEERGHIYRLPGRHRSIVPTEIPSSFRSHSVSRETIPPSGSANGGSVAGGPAAGGTANGGPEVT